jgi:hypothetical protein
MAELHCTDCNATTEHVNHNSPIAPVRYWCCTECGNVRDQEDL